ncbi:MAG TPA: hypothetical protein VMU86_05840 [Steroidobacteraceae bacterium]|nr:hypothetical protein [Steroidobacteraceae bacterium]
MGLQRSIWTTLLFATLALALARAVRAAPLDVTISADVERSVLIDGRRRIRLVPADRVVAGDPVVYTLCVRNLGPTPAVGIVVTAPVPSRMRYIAGTAVGPGAKLSFSVDDGRHYGAPGLLQVRDASGRLRPAVAADYTDLRWQLEDPLQSGSVAYLRYTAMLR